MPPGVEKRFLYCKNTRLVIKLSYVSPFSYVSPSLGKGGIGGNSNLSISVLISCSISC